MSDSHKISETDWKRWRDLADGALERLHERVLSGAANLAKGKGTPKERYRKLVGILEDADEAIRAVFDDQSRTTAVLQIASALEHGLITESELRPFSQETRAAVSAQMGEK